MNKSLSVILTTVFLDAVGIGLVMPVLPELLRSLAGEDVRSIHYGALNYAIRMADKHQVPLQDESRDVTAQLCN